MNQEAFEAAKQDIERDFGSLSDLDEELQNTIVNIYYKCALAASGSNLFRMFAGPDTSFEEAALKTIADGTFYTASRHHLPGIIREFREGVMAEGNKHDINFVTEYTLTQFKYRIGGLDWKPAFLVRIQKSLGFHKADEIPDLHKRLNQLPVDELRAKAANPAEDARVTPTHSPVFSGSDALVGIIIVMIAIFVAWTTSVD